MKRLLDVAVGTLLALAVTPLILVMALVIAVQFRANPFFLQDRVGRAGRTFRIVKIRTLPPDTSSYADKYELRSVRTHRLPALLRALHIDELPQLWLVPLGRMSLVGPRPEMAFLHERLSPDAARARTSVRPGCTGLWQVSIHAGGLIHEHPEYDVAYVSRWSLRLDAWILWHTFRLMLGRRPSVTLNEVPDWTTASPYRELDEPSRA